MKRSPLRRKSSLKRQSLKRAAERGALEDLQWLVYLRDGEWCRADHRAGALHIELPGRCFGVIDFHHVWPVGRGGPRLDARNVIRLCRGHHDWAHGHPAEAMVAGVLASGPWWP